MTKTKELRRTVSKGAKTLAWELRSAGHSFESIAKILNNGMHRGCNGQKFTAQSVGQMINPLKKYND